MDFDDYRALARDLDADAFVVTFSRGFLVHRPTAKTVASAMLDDETEQYEDRTGLLRAAVLAADESWDGVEPALEETEWCAVPLNYRVSTPAGGLITVGRIRRCDVVLRYEAVSKDHAHFVVDASGRVTHLRDNGSTHGTFVNGARIKPESAVPVHVNDHISFGPVEFEWLDAAAARATLLGA